MTWYSSGTVNTMANSPVVIGVGTLWTNSGLRPGDMLLIGYSTISPRGYEIKSIDSATQITLVLPFPVAVNGTSYAGIPMLSGDRTAITMTLATQISKALADTEAMSAVYQTFYTSPGTVNLSLPGGLVVSGSSFQKLTTDMAGKANISDLGNAASKNVGTTQGTVAAGDDSRINGALQRTGGTLTGGITSTQKSAAIVKASAGVESNGVNSLAAAYLNATQYLTVDVAGTAQNIITRIITWNTQPAFFSLYDNGNGVCGGSWLGGSDERYKGNIKDVTNGLVATLSMRHVTYDKQDGIREVGIISQDAEKFIDCAVFNAGPTKFSNGRVIENFKALNTAGFAAAAHGNAITSLFELLDLALTDPEAAKVKIAEYKSQIQKPVPLSATQKIFGGKTLEEMPDDTDFTNTDLKPENAEELSGS